MEKEEEAKLYSLTKEFNNKFDNVGRMSTFILTNEECMLYLHIPIFSIHITSKVWPISLLQITMFSC